MARPGRRVRTVQERRRAAGALGLLAGTVALSAKAAQSAGFEARVTPSHAVDTGDLHLTLTEDSDQAFTVTMGNLFPDDVGGDGGYQRLVTVTNGDTGFATVTLTASDDCASCQATDLTDDTSNGLKLYIEKCSQPWDTDGGSSPKKTYTCNGTKSNVTSLFVGAVPATAFDLSTSHNLGAGAPTYYRFWFKLPAGLAGNSPSTHQGLTSKIQYTFDGTQRAGTNK